MAVLTDTERILVWSALMGVLSRAREGLALTKPDLRAAIDAADAWADANAAAFNTALPVAARTGLTAAQKGRLLAAVVLHRFEKGS